MNSDQKKVAIGAGSGVLSMIVLVTLFYHLLPMIPRMEMPLDRIIFALRMNVFAVLPLFVGIVAIANERFSSKAIDPLRHAEDRKMEVNGRVVDNTLQQHFVFFIGTLALSTFLTATTVQFIAALTIAYILARIAFWVGYRIDPLYRAAGMAATSYMNLGILLTLLYLIVF